MKKTGRHGSKDEICWLRNQCQSHLRESEARFASLKYDITILATKLQRTGKPVTIDDLTKKKQLH